MCKLFKQVSPYKYENQLKYIQFNGTQLCKTDIIDYNVRSLIRTERGDGLSVSKSQTLFTGMETFNASMKK